MPLSTGQILNNRYRIVKLLGQGGFGAVYRAWDTNLERPRALKENLDTSEQAQRQFKREAQLLSDLSHPNLPRVIDHFILPGQGQYMVMDFIEGQDLQEMAEERSPLAESMLLPWIIQVCDALSYIHSQNPPVIHRDIKPANIRITSQGHAVLVDFGISKLYDPQLRTTIGARAVTPGYSPPEQYGQDMTDAQSDIFSLGATVYYLLTGQSPPDSVDVMTKCIPPPSAARSLNPAISPKVSDLIEQAMQLDRAQRLPSAADFKMALTTPVRSAQQQQAAIHVASIAVPTAVVQGHQTGSNQTQSEMTLTLAPGVEMTFVRVPAGPFLMGNSNEDMMTFSAQPQHAVELSEYWIGKYPVTNLQYSAFLKTKGYHEYNQKGKEQHPGVNMDWEDAAAFCRWAGQITRLLMHLPTEAEWEKAARGTDGRLYPWGDELPDKNCCNFGANIGETTRVGRYSPQGDSPYGCADMAGNVWEWCADWFDTKEYSRHLSRISQNPTGPRGGVHRVRRGGSWNNLEFTLRVSFRNAEHPNTTSDMIGFRCACVS